MASIPLVRFIAWSLGLMAATVGLVFLIPAQSEAGVQPPLTELEGHAWSSTIGWISMNCADGGSGGSDVCASSDYRVAVMNDMTLEGYGWNDNVGWVRFGGLSGCPEGGSCDARIVGDPQTGQELSGWARACAGTDSGDCSSMTDHPDGWDGWISLNCENTECDELVDENFFTTWISAACADFGCSHFGAELGMAFDMWFMFVCSIMGGCSSGTYAVDVGIGSLTSYAWGGEVAGWIDFSDVTFAAPCSPVLACLPDRSGSEYTDQWCSTTTTNCGAGFVCDTGNPSSCIPETSGLDVTFDVEPSAVRRGDSVTVQWDVGNASGCTVTRENAAQDILNSWVGLTGDETTTVEAESTFYLTCIDLASTTIEAASTSVRILPAIYES